MTVECDSILSYYGIMQEGRRYSVGELAELGGVTRRTVRYYVQEGLIPVPHGLGRGAHYDANHLEQLLRIKAMQESGMTLEAIRGEISREDRPTLGTPALPLVSRSRWTRIELMPGVELQLSGRCRVPPPRKLQELVEWCRRNLQGDREEE
jgi:DNA-binding transcriptional MerR regulator